MPKQISNIVLGLQHTSPNDLSLMSKLSATKLIVHVSHFSCWKSHLYIFGKFQWTCICGGNNAYPIFIERHSFVYSLIGCLWFIAWVRHTGKGVSSGLIRLQWRQGAWLIYRPKLLHCLAFNETVIAPGQLRNKCKPKPGCPCVYVHVRRIYNHEHNQFNINWPKPDGIGHVEKREEELEDR